MNMQRHAISAGICAVLGSAIAAPAAYAGIIPDGDYQIQILTTPILTRATAYGGTETYYAIGSAARGWNSSFTFGNMPSTSNSQAMTDNNSLSAGEGSGVAGDSVAGKINITVSGNNFTVTSLQVDTIFGTAGGNFAQYLDAAVTGIAGTSQMSGTIDNAGNMTFRPTGRLGAIDGPNPDIVDRRWNVDDNTTPGSTTWAQFTTGTVNPSNIGAVTGSVITNAGPTLNGDAYDDFTGVLVSGSRVGNDWLTFAGVGYYEVWKVNIVSVNIASNLAPVVNLTATQNGAPVTLSISNDVADGVVTVNSNATDSGGPGINSYAWSVSPVCATISGAATNPTVDVDPSGCTAGTTVQVSVDVEDTVDTTSASASYQVVAAAVADTDADGIPDADDRSPNDASVIQLSNDAGIGQATVDTGDFQLGNSANCAGNAGILVTEAQIFANAGAGCTAPANTTPESFTQTGGIFDYKITNLALGATVNVVIPLTEAVPAGAVLRKYTPTGGWVNFNDSGSDSYATALGAAGNCPNANDQTYLTSELTEGAYCLRLTLVDGGANDADGARNGVIVDPVAIAVDPALLPPTPPTQPSPLQSSFDTSGGGCTLGNAASPKDRLDVALLGAFLLGLGVLRRRLFH